MYLSLLRIDVHNVRGRTWLANPYRVHQRLAMAFPDGQSGRVLFRMEAEWQPPRILVQCPCMADWRRAFYDHPVLAGEPLQKELRLCFQPGQRLRFLLRANPTARRAAPPAPSAGGNRPLGLRVGLLKEAEQRDWLARKGEGSGFRPLAVDVRSAGQIVFPRGDGAPKQTHLSVDFQGYLAVDDPDAFARTLEAGIGAAKAFGFGLLSVAPG